MTRSRPFSVGPRRGTLRSIVGALAALVILTAPASAAPGWTGPRSLGSSVNCYGEPAVAVDPTGATHVAAVCNSYVRVSHRSAGLGWTTIQFGHPADRFDLGPQVAIDGGRLYVAFTRAATGDCGLDYIGVYVRSRTLPTGAWSQPTRLGSAGDRLQVFVVVQGAIHATVDDGDSLIYETTASGALKRYPLTDATLSRFSGTSSLAVGSDGLARIVYQGQSSLRFAIFRGSRFATSSIPGTGKGDRDPRLVLDARNNAHVVWTHAAHPGCDVDQPAPADGTYYATNTTGAWAPSRAAVTRRITRNVGATSLALDAGGRPHVLVGGVFGVKYYTPGSGTWSGLTLSSHRSQGVAIRSGPATPTLFVAYARVLDEVGPNLYYLTKP